MEGKRTSHTHKKLDSNYKNKKIKQEKIKTSTLPLSIPYTGWYARSLVTETTSEPDPA